MGVYRSGRTELHYAASENDLTKMQSLLASGAEVDLPDDDGWTPLHFASQAYSVVAAEMLLVAGATVDAKDSYGNTPLSKAVFNSRGRGELITLLRRHGADPNMQNVHGISPFALAKSISNFDVKRHFADLPD